MPNDLYDDTPGFEEGNDLDAEDLSDADVERFSDDSHSCPECGADVYVDATICPECGYARSDRPGTTPVWAVITGLALVAAISGVVCVVAFKIFY